MSRKKPPRAPLWGRVAAQTMPRTLPATGRAPMASAPSQVAVRPGKQLTYDLTARIVDSDELPVNTIIVSTWARTGWNVIRPNVLIDATATGT